MLKKRINIIIWILLSLGFLLLAAGCQQSRKDPGTKGRLSEVKLDSLRVGFSEAVTSLDPIRVQSYAEMQVARALYEGLFTLEPDTGRLAPLLVENWELSSDAKTYTFHLRKEIKFHSSRELTAEDVKFSWQRVLLLGEPKELANTFGLVIGAKDYIEGRTGGVAGFVVTDPYTLQVTLERPYQQFLMSLTHPGAAIVDKEVMQLIGKDYGKPGNHESPLVVLVGTGPFSIVEWLGEQQITFQAFELYHSEVPAVKRLEFIHYPDLETLYTDFMAEYLDLVLSSGLYNRVQVPDKQIIHLPSTGFYYLGLNSGIKPFDSLEIRQAVSRSLDRESLAGKFQGIASDGLLPRLLLEERPPSSRYQYEPKQVQAMFSDENFRSNLEQAWTLTLPEGEEWSLIASEIQKQLEEVGWLLELQILPLTEFKRITPRGEVSLFLDYQQSLTVSPQPYFETRFAARGLANQGSYFDSVVEERLDFLENEADSERERLGNLLEIEQRIQNDAQIIALWQRNHYLVFQEGLAEIPLLPLGLVAWEKYSFSH